MRPDKENSIEVKTKLDEVIEKSNVRKVILEKLLNRLKMDVEDSKSKENGSK